jgi:outer membrane lipoprotein SlyB
LPRVVSSVGASVTVGSGAGSVVGAASEIGSGTGMVCSSVVGSVVASVLGSVVPSFVVCAVVLCVLVVVFSDEPQAHKLTKIPKQIIIGSILFIYLSPLKIYHKNRCFATNHFSCIPTL